MDDHFVESMLNQLGVDDTARQYIEGVYQLPEDNLFSSVCDVHIGFTGVKPYVSELFFEVEINPEYRSLPLNKLDDLIERAINNYVPVLSSKYHDHEKMNNALLDDMLPLRNSDELYIAIKFIFPEEGQ